MGNQGLISPDKMVSWLAGSSSGGHSGGSGGWLTVGISYDNGWHLEGLGYWYHLGLAPPSLAIVANDEGLWIPNVKISQHFWWWLVFWEGGPKISLIPTSPIGPTYIRQCTDSRVRCQHIDFWFLSPTVTVACQEERFEIVFKVYLYLRATY